MNKETKKELHKNAKLLKEIIETQPKLYDTTADIGAGEDEYYYEIENRIVENLFKFLDCVMLATFEDR